MLTWNLVEPILTVEEVNLVKPSFNRSTGRLRSSKPVSKIDFNGPFETAVHNGSSNYIWRMLAFAFSDYGKNSCMPVCADLGVSSAFYARDKRNNCIESNRKERYNEVKDCLDRLDSLIKRVESVVPIIAQVGTIRWGRALGMI